MDFAKTFSDRLTKLLASHYLSKQSLANELGVKRQAVSQFANGTNLPAVSTLISIADYFCVSLDYLTGRSNNPRPNTLCIPPMKLFAHPDGEVFYSFVIEDFTQPKSLKCKHNILDGELKYTFGIFQDQSTKKERYFLYLDDPRDKLIYPYILLRQGQLVFIALTSFLSWKVGFQYNPYNPENMDILIFNKENDGLRKVVAITMEATSSSRIFNISDDYCYYVEEYIKKTTLEKATILANFLP